MDPESIARTSSLLANARKNSTIVPEIPAADAPQSIDDGYALQAVLHENIKKSGNGYLAGWKIGATTASMQSYLGVDGPAYGRIVNYNIYPSDAELPATGFVNPGIECEIAVRIGDVSTAGVHSRDSVVEIIDAVLPAMEIVENRYGNFLARNTPTLIADDFFHKACVIGNEVLDWQDIDLAAISGRTSIDGVNKGTGVGADVMGHPLEAVAWLSNTLSAHSVTLKKGQVILTGSVAPVIWLESFPCFAEIELGDLGRVTATLTG